jgi:hypothetical protein
MRTVSEEKSVVAEGVVAEAVIAAMNGERGDERSGENHAAESSTAALERDTREEGWSHLLEQLLLVELQRSHGS